MVKKSRKLRKRGLKSNMLSAKKRRLLENLKDKKHGIEPRSMF